MTTNDKTFTYSKNRNSYASKNAYMKKIYFRRRFTLAIIILIILISIFIIPLAVSTKSEQLTSVPDTKELTGQNLLFSVAPKSLETPLSSESPLLSESPLATSTPVSTPVPTSSMNENSTPKSDPDSMVKLNIPLVMQLPELPAGCEITSVTMMLLYSGASVNKIDLAIEMPRHDISVSKGFVGDPFKPVGNINTIFPPALMDLVSKYAGNAVDLTGAGLDKIKNQIKSGYPVVVWISMAETGGLHCVCVYGYDDDNIYYNDPLYSKKSMSNSEFLEKWGKQKQRAISYVN